MSADTAGKSPYGSEAVRRMIYEPDWKTLENISEQAKGMLEKQDYEGVGRLLRRYGESEDVVSRIALHIYKADLSRTPEQAAQKDIVELFGRFSETYLMRRGGNDPEETGIPQVTAARHTFMLDHYVREHPDCGIARPEAQKIEAALRLLDRDGRTQDRTFSELYDYLMMCQPPSMYVQLRYGMAEDYKLHLALEDGMETEVLKERYGTVPDHTVVSARLIKTAEKALEGICDRPPNPYLDQLNEELEKLGRLAVNPKSIDDLFIYNDFLVKYGIDRKSPEEVRVRQAETAYRELDARFVKMTGRRPYADDLFWRNRQKTEVTENAGDRSLRNKPKGRRMGM